MRHNQARLLALRTERGACPCHTASCGWDRHRLQSQMCVRPYALGTEQPKTDFSSSVRKRSQSRDWLPVPKCVIPTGERRLSHRRASEWRVARNGVPVPAIRRPVDGTGTVSNLKCALGHTLSVQSNQRPTSLPPCGNGASPGTGSPFQSARYRPGSDDSATAERVNGARDGTGCLSLPYDVLRMRHAPFPVSRRCGAKTLSLKGAEGPAVPHFVRKRSQSRSQSRTTGAEASSQGRPATLDGHSSRVPTETPRLPASMNESRARETNLLDRLQAVRHKGGAQHGQSFHAFPGQLRHNHIRRRLKPAGPSKARLKRRAVVRAVQPEPTPTTRASWQGTAPGNSSPWRHPATSQQSSRCRQCVPDGSVLVTCRSGRPW